MPLELVGDRVAKRAPEGPPVTVGVPLPRGLGITNTDTPSELRRYVRDADDPQLEGVECTPLDFGPAKKSHSPRGIISIFLLASTYYWRHFLIRVRGLGITSGARAQDPTIFRSPPPPYPLNLEPPKLLAPG